MLGLRFYVRAFSSCGKRGPLFIAVRGPLLLWSTGSRRAGSVVVAHRLSCSVAYGIFPDQGLNPCPLHWQADSQPLHHQGSPRLDILKCAECCRFALSHNSVRAFLIQSGARLGLALHKGWSKCWGKEQLEPEIDPPPPLEGRCGPNIDGG